MGYTYGLLPITLSNLVLRHHAFQYIRSIDGGGGGYTISLPISILLVMMRELCYVFDRLLNLRYLWWQCWILVSGQICTITGIWLSFVKKKCQYKHVNIVHLKITFIKDSRYDYWTPSLHLHMSQYMHFAQSIPECYLKLEILANSFSIGMAMPLLKPGPSFGTN